MAIGNSGSYRFIDLDKNFDGFLDNEELSPVIENYKTVVKDMPSAYDYNGDGYLEWSGGFEGGQNELSDFLNASYERFKQPSTIVDYGKDYSTFWENFFDGGKYKIDELTFNAKFDEPFYFGNHTILGSKVTVTPQEAALWQRFRTASGSDHLIKKGEELAAFLNTYSSTKVEKTGFAVSDYLNKINDHFDKNGDKNKITGPEVTFSGSNMKLNSSQQDAVYDETGMRFRFNDKRPIENFDTSVVYSPAFKISWDATNEKNKQVWNYGEMFAHYFRYQNAADKPHRLDDKEFYK